MKKFQKHLDSIDIIRTFATVNNAYNENDEDYYYQELSQHDDTQADGDARGGTDECKQLRDVYPLVEVRQMYDAMDGLLHLYTKDIPKVCFSSLMENRNKQRIMRAYNGLVLLEVNNLAGFEEAEAVRKGAAQIPHTLLAFVGASGRSVKIVCRGELFDGGLPENDDDISRFHTNLYEKARVAYNMQLGVTIEKLEPTLDRDCYVSCDANLYYNPSAQPFYTDCSDVTKAVQPVTLYAEKQDRLMPGIDNSHAMNLIYEYCRASRRRKAARI